MHPFWGSAGPSILRQTQIFAVLRRQEPFKGSWGKGPSGENGQSKFQELASQPIPQVPTWEMVRSHPQSLKGVGFSGLVH